MKIERIVFATGNAGKIREIQAILADLGLEVASMKEAGVSADIEEDGCTYEENALIKSRAVAACLKKAGRLEGTVVMADDSGLEIDYLNKEPGVFSARYMGEDTSYRIKNANLVGRLEVLPDGRELTSRGVIEGRIGYEEKGSNGFGYDPIFYVPEFGRTTAELTEEEKNRVSHRGSALRQMKQQLQNVMA